LDVRTTAQTSGCAAARSTSPRVIANDGLGEVIRSIETSTNRTGTCLPARQTNPGSSETARAPDGSAAIASTIAARGSR